jgi:hypothetical protein
MWRAIVVSAWLVGCGGEVDQGGTLDEVVSQWLVNNASPAANDCGSLATCALDANVIEEEAVTCLAAAWEQCEPTVAGWTQTTIEGDPVHHKVAVFDDGARCRLAWFIDSRDDSFGVDEVSVRTCGQLVAADEGQCPSLEVLSCDPEEILVGG